MNTLEDIIKQFIDANRDKLYDKKNKQLTFAGALFICLTTCKVFGILPGLEFQFDDKEK